MLCFLIVSFYLCDFCITLIEKMDSSSDREDVLVIDDNSSGEENDIIDVDSSHSSVKSPDIVNQLGCHSSPLRNNHPKLKRKFQGDNCWGSSGTKDTTVLEENESSPKSNGTGNHSMSPNSLEEHTYAKKVLSPPPADTMKDSSSTCDEEKGLEKLEIELSALCTVLYSSQKKEIVSISIDQFFNLPEALNLAGATSQPSNSYSRKNASTKQRLAQPSSSMNTSPSTNGTEKITLSSFPKPVTCVCCKPCICSKVLESKDIIKSLPSYKVEPVVTSTSNSDDVVTPPKKIDRRGRPRKNQIITKPVRKEPVIRKPKVMRISKKMRSVVKEVSTSIPSGVHQCPPDCSYGKDLLVFAKWPADKIYYPAIVHGCFYTDWEYSNNLSVEFFDGAAIKMSSCNIFPASLVIKGTLITYKNSEDEYIEGIVKSVERTHSVSLTKSSTCLSFLIECTEDGDSDYGKVCTVPFLSVALNDQCYKCLKKEIGETVLTPHKFSRKTYNVCHDNLIEGKRTRRGAEEAVALILSEELDRKENLIDGELTKRRRFRKKTVKEETNQDSEQRKGVKRKRRSFIKSLNSLESDDENYSPQSVKRLETPPKRRSFPKNRSVTSEKKSKLDHSEIPSTSTTKRPRAVKELVFRKDVVSEEEHSDSEPDDDFEPDFDMSIVGGGDIDYECTTYTQSSRKCIGNRVVKSSLKKTEKVEDDESLINRSGPVPKSPLFAGYSFVLTYGGQNSYYRKKISDNVIDPDGDSYVFDQLRLRKQIAAGKGHIFKHLLSIPKDSRDKTLVISDFQCRTANYLLAAALNIPVYSHHIIIQCCIQNVPLEEMIASNQPLPVGITSDQVRHKFTKKRKVETMKSYTVIFASTESNQRLKFWTKLIHLSGGKISYFTPKRSILGGVLSLASVVIVDDYCTTYLVDSAKKNNVPIVSTRWLIDTVIRGHKQTMMSTDLPQYQVDLIMSSQASSFSEAQ